MTSALIAAGKAPVTAAGARVILRRALTDAVRDGLVVRNVAALARPPRVPLRDVKYLDISQLRTLIAAAANEALAVSVADVDGRRVEMPIGPIVSLAAVTGLRQGELLGLGWVDTDLEARTLTVRRSLARSADGGWELAEPKTGRSRRQINLPDAAVEALARHGKAQEAAREVAGALWQDGDALVFTDALGRPLRGHNVTRQFHRLLEAAGLPPVPFHALRHSAATALLAAGVPLRVVADVLGHSTIVVTANVYAAVVPELRREAADAMDRALG
jgi:integrase